MTVYESRILRVLKDKIDDRIDQRKEDLATTQGVRIEYNQGYIAGLRDALELASEVDADMNAQGA